MTKSSKKTFNILLTMDYWRALKNESDRLDCTMSNIVRGWIRTLIIERDGK